MPDQTDKTRIMTGLAGVTLVGRSTMEESGALMPRNLSGDGDYAKGVFLDQAAPGSTVEARTANHVYLLRFLGKGTAEISGHPEYCPRPVRVMLNGSQWLDQKLPECFVGPGMQLQFVTLMGQSILTSPIESVAVRRA